MVETTIKPQDLKILQISLKNESGPISKAVLRKANRNIREAINLNHGETQKQ